jgi:hypothetical protein
VPELIVVTLSSITKVNQLVMSRDMTADDRETFKQSIRLARSNWHRILEAAAKTSDVRRGSTPALATAARRATTAYRETRPLTFTAGSAALEYNKNVSQAAKDKTLKALVTALAKDDLTCILACTTIS